jgi:ABC-2 type transport system ATP-binding protein
VLTTHYLEEAEELADTIAVIDKGRLVTLDTPARLIERHGHKRLQITFAAPPAEPLPPALRALDATLDGSRLELRLPAGQDLRALLHGIEALGPITDVRTEQPTLEHVFLALTGEAGAA